MWLCHRVMSPNNAEGMANSVDLDQTAPLIWVCTVCPGISVQKLRIITVGNIKSCQWQNHDQVTRLREKNGISEKQLTALKCKFARKSEIFFVYPMLKFMANSTTQ